MKKIGITGSTGFIGSNLKNYLTEKGFEVVSIKRGSFDNLENLDALIHLSGANVAKKRWSKAFKKELIDSRVETTKALSSQINLLKKPPKTIFVASGIGFYGDRNDELLNERSSGGHTFLADLTKRWQDALDIDDKNKIRTIFMRFGVVLSPDAGALKKMLLPFKLFLGSIMGSGKQYISWITLDDLLRAIVFILENDTIQGPVNFTTPNPVTNEEFNHLLAKAIKRPLFLKMPEFLVRKIFGEMGQALFLDSTKAYPKALLDHGFKFLYPNIKDAFNHFFNK